MKRIIPVLFAVLFAVFGLVGCSKYTSHYSAVLHVRSNNSVSGMTSFAELDGTDVFVFKCKDGKTAKIQYSGKLEEGSLTVYYDFDGTKTKLFSAKSGEEINSISDTVSGKEIYVVIETDGKCKNGNFGFELIYD